MAEKSSPTRRSRRPTKEFNLGSFLWRLLASLFLVLVTYNPSNYSYLDWVLHATPENPRGPGHFVVGVGLLIGWVILLVATHRSLGTFGLILGGALLGGVVWLLTDLGWLSIETVSAATWVALVCIAALLAIGLSWSHVWRRLTGQFEVDDDD